MDGLIMLLIKLIVCNWKALLGVPFAGGLNRIIKSKKKKKIPKPWRPSKKMSQSKRELGHFAE